RLVAGDRLRLAPALGRDALGVHAARNHVVPHRVGAPLRKPLLVSVRPDRVGVPLDQRSEVRVFLHRRHDLRLDLLLALGLERRLVEVEVRVGRELDLLGGRRWWRRRRWWWWWRRLLLRIADEVPEQGPDGGAADGARASGRARLLVAATVTALVRVVEAAGGAGTDHGTHEHTGCGEGGATLHHNR